MQQLDVEMLNFFVEKNYTNPAKKNPNIFLVSICKNPAVVLEMVLLFVESFGADINCAEEGKSPLHYVCQNENITLDILK